MSNTVTSCGHMQDGNESRETEAATVRGNVNGKGDRDRSITLPGRRKEGAGRVDSTLMTAREEAQCRNQHRRGEQSAQFWLVYAISAHCRPGRRILTFKSRVSVLTGTQNFFIRLCFHWPNFIVQSAGNFLPSTQATLEQQ